VELTLDVRLAEPSGPSGGTLRGNPPWEPFVGTLRRNRYDLLMTEGAPKSAFELAMERLRKKDAEQGIVERPLTDQQKREIAEIRSTYEARLAQTEVMHRDAMMKTMEPEAIAMLEENYRREREQLTSERDRKIEKVREKVEE
jgi:hypothetical protein